MGICNSKKINMHGIPDTAAPSPSTSARNVGSDISQHPKAPSASITLTAPRNSTIKDMTAPVASIGSLSVESIALTASSSQSTSASPSDAISAFGFLSSSPSCSAVVDGLALSSSTTTYHHNVVGHPAAYISSKQFAFTRLDDGSTVEGFRSNWLDHGSYGRISMAVVNGQRMALKTIVVDSRSLAVWLQDQASPSTPSESPSSPCRVFTSLSLRQPRRKHQGSRIKASQWRSILSELETGRSLASAAASTSANLNVPQLCWVDGSKLNAKNGAPHITVRMAMPFLPLSLEYVTDSLIGPECCAWQASPEAAMVAPLVARDLSAALSAVHRAGLVHRDLKSDNVLADLAGNFYLSDFGLAVKAGKPSPPGGNYVTVPPEVSLTSSGLPAPSADVWALGVVVAQTLAPVAGQRNPFLEWETAAMPLASQQGRWINLLQQHGGKLPQTADGFRAFPASSTYCTPTIKWLKAVAARPGGPEALMFLSAAFTIDAAVRPSADELVVLANEWCDAMGAVSRRQVIMDTFLPHHTRAKTAVERKQQAFQVVESAVYLHAHGVPSADLPPLVLQANKTV